MAITRLKNCKCGSVPKLYVGRLKKSDNPLVQVFCSNDDCSVKMKMDLSRVGDLPLMDYDRSLNIIDSLWRDHLEMIDRSE